MTKKQFLEKWSRLMATNAKEWYLAIKFNEDLSALLKQVRVETYKECAEIADNQNLWDDASGESENTATNIRNVILREAAAIRQAGRGK